MKRQDLITAELAYTTVNGKPLLSKANMAALLVSDFGQQNLIAIPPGLTYSQVLIWLENSCYVFGTWKLAGIYQYT